MKVYVLVKDFGYEGLHVYGVVSDEQVADLWSKADGGACQNDYIEVAVDATIGGFSLSTQSRKGAKVA